MIDTLEKQILDIALPFIEREGFTLYDLDIAGGERKPLLRIYIDKKGGVTLGDCSSVSRHISTVIEVEEIIKGAFNIEVSSPGLTRTLKKPVHFQKSVGSLIKLSFRKSFGGANSLVGRLKEADGEKYRVAPEDGGEEVKFTFNDVSKAKLEFEG